MAQPVGRHSSETDVALPSGQAAAAQPPLGIPRPPEPWAHSGQLHIHGKRKEPGAERTDLRLHGEVERPLIPRPAGLPRAGRGCRLSQLATPAAPRGPETPHPLPAPRAVGPGEATVDLAGRACATAPGGQPGRVCGFL